MGEVAEMILDGTLCQSCGVFIGEGEGFPKECAYCRRAGKAAGKVACPVCKKKIKGLNDHIRDAHPGHAEREKATHETATREMLDSARADLEMLREALGVPAEPHQSLLERMVEAAQAKRGAVPEGYDIAPAFRGYARLGIGQYVLHNCPRADDERPSLVIAIATEEEKADRQVGELRHVTPGLMIQPDRIAVRLDFENASALDALEQQLRFLREDSFPDSLAAPAPAPAKVSMPVRLADAIVREVAELPDRDSPADWPAAMLVTSDELRGIVRAALRGEVKPAKCDGDHGGPRCADPECWQDPDDDVIDVRTAAERLVKRALAVGVVLTIETQPRQPLAMGNYDVVVQTREARKGGAA